MDLEFFTTEELITELIGRATFVGAVIHSTTEHRFSDTIHSNFQISTNLDDKNLARLMGLAVESIESGSYHKIIK